MILHTLVSSFSCAHFYARPQWSPAKNQQVFGKCFTAYGHGHDYRLEVSLSGSIDDVKPKLTRLHQLLDHQHLNFVIPEFKDQVPTTENLALFCLKQLSNPSIKKLKLYERSDLWVELSL